MRKPSPFHLTVLSILVCAFFGAGLSEAVKPSLGEWSTECDSAFTIGAMPTAWDFCPAQGALQINARLSVDYGLLQAADWEMVQGENSNEASARLLGYEDMLLEARVYAVGSIEPLIRLDGRYNTEDGAKAVVFFWDGRDQAGNVLKAGRYEIEVHGRFIPVSLNLQAENLSYRDLDGWGEIAEACTRVLRVNITDTPQTLPTTSTRSAFCPSPPPLPADYYDTVDATDATTLRSTLHDVIDDHTRWPYTSTGLDTWDILSDADVDPTNENNVLTVYKNASYPQCTTGTGCLWNREHTWAKSYGFAESENSGAGRFSYTDCHHLRACDMGYNSSRGNRPFNDCTSGCSTHSTDVNNGFGGAGQDNLGSGGTTACNNTPSASDLWEPWDHHKGDVARSILYMDVRYAGDTGAFGYEQDLIVTDTLSLMMVGTITCGNPLQDPGYHGILSTLLAWHCADMPDAEEIFRNEQVWCHQGNRNPFVDHPEYTGVLYGVECTGPIFGGILTATDADPCASTGVQVDWLTPIDWNDDCTSPCKRSFTVFRDLTEITTGGCGVALPEASTTCIDTTGTPGVTYNYSVQAENNIGAISGGSAGRDGTDLTDDGTMPLITGGPSAAPIQTAFTASWTTDELSDSFLEWGASTGVYTESTSDAGLVTNHSLDATPLSPETQYFYRVCSSDACANGPRCSNEATVTTITDPSASEVFINEVHYDNAGADANEGVEVAGTAGTDLTGWSIGVYNGNGGGFSGNMSPNPVPISGTIPDFGSGLGALWFAISGIENGAPDGVALIDDTNTVIQFLCYEGTFTATTGAANGMLCDDIGVEETWETLATESLQLTGTGCAYADFTWTGPVASSHDLLNTGQVADCNPVQEEIFSDGFESGDFSAWSLAVP